MGLLGYSTISLTDLTEVLPASLYLSSSLVSNSQTKEGSNYTPDFSQNGNEVIITPSFFMGTEEIAKKEGEADCPYKTNIRYQCGDVDENGNEITYSYTASGADNYVWVDSDARLHYKKNLNKSIIIEAWIEGWVDTNNQISYPSIPALNPINILLLTETGGYSAFIASKDGREHFEEGNENAITLVASLYNGATKMAIDNCKWYQASNVDAEGNLVQLETNEEAGIAVNGNELTVRRKAVKTLDTFICEIIISTGLVFRVSMNLLDKTDSYYGNIIADGSLILTPEHNSINLISQLWSGVELINGDDTSATRFKYEWFYLKDNERKEVGNARELKVGLTDKDTDDNFIYPQKDSFIIYCQSEIDGKTYVLSNVSIQYSPIIYSVQKRPETFFVPALNGGTYYSSEKVFEQKVSFKLVGADGQTLAYDVNTDSAPSFSNEIAPFVATVESAEANKWSFNITFTYNPKEDTDKKFNDLANSFYFTFGYKYLGVDFQDDFVCVKNEAGMDGTNGAPAYTVYLDNEFVSFSADSLGELSENEQTYKITPSVFLGAEEKNYVITNATPPEGITTTISGDKQNVVVSIDKTKIATLLNKPNGTISVDILVDSLTFVRMITYSVRFSSISYYLQLSASTFTRDLAYTFTPAQITVSALYKRSGQETPNACTSGFLLLTAYGDGGVLLEGMGHSQIIGGSVSNILTISETDLNVSVKYFIVEFFDKEGGTLYDRQTVPVLVDSGDIEVGGVNLLRYTKKMPSRTISEKDYWQYSNAALLNVSDEDAKMVELSYNGAEEWQSMIFFQSMEMPLEGFASNYTLSFDVYSEDYSAFVNNLTFNMALHGADGKHDTRWRWRDMALFNGNEMQNGVRIVDGDFESGKWARLAFTFSPKFNETFFTLPEIPSSQYTFGTVRYVSFAFWSYKTCNLKIKKIKLEKGNIPTDWSESPYDVEYEDIRGTNLLPAFLATKVYPKNKSEGTEWLVSFERGNYTLSWDGNASSSTNSETILRANKYLPNEGIDFKVTNSYTFFVEEENDNSEFVLYTNTDNGDEHYSMYQLKLEKGSVATPYVLSTEQIQQYYNDYVNGTDGVVNKIITIAGADGTIRNMLADDFQKYTDSINELNANYQTLQSEYTSLIPTKEGFDEWKSYYLLGKDDNGRSILTLGDKSADYDMKMRLTSTKMSFLDKEEEVAYISNEKLFINYAEIVQQMRIGSSENTGYLVFKHMAGGLGVVWETK